MSQDISQSKNPEISKDTHENTINCSLDVSCYKENLNSTQLKTRENSTVQTLQDLPKVLEASHETMNNDKSKEGQGKSLGSDEKTHPQTPLNNKKSLTSFEILNERSFSISKGQGSHRTYTENSGLKVSDIIASKDTLNDPLTNKKKLIQLCKEKKNERSLSSGKKKRRSLDVERSQDENKKECQVFLKRQKLDLPKLRRSKSFGNKQMSPNLNNLEALKKKVNCKKVMTKSSSSCLLSTPFLPEGSNKKVFKNSEQKLVNKENNEIDVQSHEIHKKNKNNLSIEKSVLKNIINNEKGTLQEEIKENWSYEAVNTRLDSEWDYYMINDGSMNMSLGRISLGKKNSHVKNIEKVYGAKSNPKSKNWAPILSNKN